MLVTDLAYPAQGRRYGDEDVLLAARLRTAFDLVSCPPLDAARVLRGLSGFDGVLVRNSGPVLHYPVEHADLLAAVRERGVALYNPATGRGDMQGKGYLLELFAAGFPVIPTVDRLADLDRLPAVRDYVVKPVAGADSIGLRVVPAAGLAEVEDAGRAGPAAHRLPVRGVVRLRGPRLPVRGVRAATLPARWRLEPYPATPADLAFAQQFVDWNVSTTASSASTPAGRPPTSCCWSSSRT